MRDIYRQQLETFACMSEFHRRALYVMASELPEADIGHLRRITFFDLVKLFESEERALETMNDLALSKSDVITYEMFKSIMTEMLGDSKTNH